MGTTIMAYIAYNIGVYIKIMENRMETYILNPLVSIRPNGNYRA